MGTIARNIYLFVPFVLTAIALGLLITVMLSQHSTGTLSNLYFLRINTYDLNIPINVQNVHVSLQSKELGLPAYYDIGLTNFCTGTSNTSAPNFCSKPQAAFYFNPIEIWNLDDSPIGALVPSEWNSALNSYKEASKFMYAAYVVALVAAIVTFLLGIASFFLSRFTSILTWVAALVAAIFSAGASATATAIFSIIAGTIRAKLHADGVSTTFGSRLFALSWIATAATILATLLFTCGCCCGHDKKRDLHRARSFGARSNYERVPSPFKPEAESAYAPHAAHTAPHDAFNGMQMYGQPQHQHPASAGAPMHQHTAYEPYRQV